MGSCYTKPRCAIILYLCAPEAIGCESPKPQHGDDRDVRHRVPHDDERTYAFQAGRQKAKKSEYDGAIEREHFPCRGVVSDVGARLSTTDVVERRKQETSADSE